MTKLKLKRWVKVVLSLLILGVWVLIYNQTGKLGELAQTSNIYLALCVAAWTWLIFGSLSSIYYIWEN